MATKQHSRVIAAIYATAADPRQTNGINGTKLQELDATAHQRKAASVIARMERGLHLGGGGMVNRDELHQR